MPADPRKLSDSRTATATPGAATPAPGTLADSADLRFINEHHNFSTEAFAAQATTGGLLGRLRRALRTFLLGDYERREQEFHAHLVRHLNEISKLLAGKQLRLADDHWATVDTMERRLGAALEQLGRELRSTLGTLDQSRAIQEGRLGTLESMIKGLERLMAQLNQADTVRPESGEAQGAAPSLSFDPAYLLLENRFRGSEEEISKRLRSYVEIFQDVSAPVLEIGAGRGELQRHFRQASIPSYALEINDGMLAQLRAEQIDVRAEDALKHLQSVAAASLGGIVAIQVIEHLQPAYLRNLLQESRRVLLPGGKLALETINTESLLALCHNYFRDPTHAAPVHPDTLRFLVEISGFEVIAIEPLSPYPEAAKLRELVVADFMSPRWQEFVDVINQNVRELNRILYGYQDYRLTAKAV